MSWTISQLTRPQELVIVAIAAVVGTRWGDPAGCAAVAFVFAELMRATANLRATFASGPSAFVVPSSPNASALAFLERQMVLNAELPVVYLLRVYDTRSGVHRYKAGLTRGSRTVHPWTRLLDVYANGRKIEPHKRDDEPSLGTDSSESVRNFLVLGLWTPGAFGARDAEAQLLTAMRAVDPAVWKREWFPISESAYRTAWNILTAPGRPGDAWVQEGYSVCDIPDSGSAFEGYCGITLAP
jgi:hypothetical protein